MTPHTGKDIDPQVQAIFDAMFAYMQTVGVPTCNSWVNRTGNGTNYGISVTGFDASQASQTFFTPGDRVAVTPTNPSLGPGETQQFSASATDANGVDLPSATFTWRMAAGSPGNVSATGVYTAPATIPNPTTALVTATVSDNTAWTSVNIALHP
jgi:Bacterial Ig-like domain (group 2)